MTADDPKYWAFISYSHRDAKVAKALQRALETYRLPGRLIGTVTAVGTIPEYVKPVFRDRDEMEAGADLKATVREALRQSRYLIVVCSPDAARSPWVNQEIVEFKKLTGESHVLALIAAGEPYASRIAGREAEECFPEALRFALDADGLPRGETLEPIAADLRPQGDGNRLALFKLIAGMIGVGVDSLVRRDAQRRARRLAYVASGAVAGMAVMAVLTVMAVQSRIEAQKQRAQAEDLIEFMLGDLRKKLDPVGRLDVLDSVGEKALGYYAKQDTDKLDANALGRRSRAMHLIGEMREQRGQLDQALAAFKNASDTTAELLARYPNDGQRVFDHAQSVYWVGYIAWRRGEAEAAEDAFLKYRELAQRLVQIDPNNMDWQLETAHASQNLGVIQLERLRLTSALQSFLERKIVLARLASTRPVLTLDLSDAVGWIAKTKEASGNYAEAINAQQERIQILDSAPDAKRDMQAQRWLANANYELGSLFLASGNLTEAEKHAAASVRIAADLVSADSANMFRLSEWCFDDLSLAEIEIALGKRANAKTTIERVMPSVSRLMQSDTSAMNWQINLRGRELLASARLSEIERQPFSSSELEVYVSGVRHFEEQGKRLNALQSTIVAGVELLLGDVLNKNSERDLAANHWRAVAARLHPLMGQENYPILTILARAQLRLGHYSEARALAGKVQASTYRHPAYAELTNELTQVAGQRQSNLVLGSN